MEIGNLPPKEFKLMTMQMAYRLRKRMANMQGMFTRNLEELKNRQTEVNHTVSSVQSLSCA